MAIVNGTPASDNGTSAGMLLGTSLEDTLNANWSAGDDLMFGGFGNDTYHINSTGDLIVGEQPNLDPYVNTDVDAVVSRVSSYTLPANVEVLRLDGFGYLNGPIALNGTGNDVGNGLLGNAAANVLDGQGGDDGIRAGGGDDTVRGGDGDDQNLYGDAGRDDLYGDAGYDTLHGGNDADTLHGGDGDDVLWCDNGNDVAYGDAGDDTIGGNDGSDTLHGGAGNDELHGGYWTSEGQGHLIDGNEILYGESGDDHLDSGNGSDWLFGGTGNDQLWSGDADDNLYGDDGADDLRGNAGHDRMFGGAGKDNFHFAGSEPESDTIGDFSHADDTIRLAADLDGFYDSHIEGLRFSPLDGLLQPTYFHSGAGVRGNGAADPGGVYVDTSDGSVWFNMTSAIAGDARQLCTVGASAASTMDASDFAAGFSTLIVPGPLGGGLQATAGVLYAASAGIGMTELPAAVDETQAARTMDHLSWPQVETAPSGMAW